MTAAIEAGGVVDSRSTERTWWLGQRSARAIDLYRVLLGCGLTVHFARAFFQVTPWLDRGRLLPPGTSVGLLRHSALDQGLSLYEPRLAFGIAIASSLAIVLGVFPRIAAGLLYAVSVAVYWTLLPMATHDDHAAIAVALLLVLLPSGYSRLSLRFRSGAPRPEAAVPGTSTTALLVCILAVYLTGAVGALSTLEESRAAVVNNGFRVVAVLYVVPVLPAQLVGVALQVALHGYLVAQGQSPMLQVALAGTSVLFWGEKRRGSSRWVLDAGSVVMGVALAVASAGVVGVVSPSLRVARVTQLAVDAGLLPVHWMFGETPGNSAFVRMKVGGGHTRTWPVERERADPGARERAEPGGRERAEPGERERADPDARADALISRLGSAAANGAVARSAAAVIARRFCKDHGGELDGYPGAVWSERPTRAPVVRFTCSADGELSGVR